jgi:hypothetical protein
MAADCPDPQIFNSTFPNGVTPFNYSQMLQQDAACYDSGELKEISDKAFLELMSNPVIRGSILASGIVRKMHNTDDGWKVVTDELGTDCTTPSPEIEYILSSLGIAVEYAPSMAPMSTGLLNPLARQEYEHAPRFGPEHPYIPCNWRRIKGITVERLQENMINKHDYERGCWLARRESIQKLKKKMSLELQEILATTAPAESDDDATPIPRAPHPDNHFEHYM